MRSGEIDRTPEERETAHKCWKLSAKSGELVGLFTESEHSTFHLISLF